MGDYPKALSSYEKALAVQQQSFPPSHPDSVFSYNTIGNVYREMGDYSRAFSSCEKYWQFGKNHFLRITLIWICHTTI
jgi:tetratricopeptide (TPR) repeat protein